MSNNKEKKSKEHKLRELEFWFESYRKKEREFRENPVYMAIFAAIDRLNYKPFLPYDIEKDIRKYKPEVIADLKREKNEDYVVGRSIGSRLKQMVSRSILKILDEPEIRRQKTFALDGDVKDKFKGYIKQLLKHNKIIGSDLDFG